MQSTKTTSLRMLSSDTGKAPEPTITCGASHKQWIFNPGNKQTKTTHEMQLLGATTRKAYTKGEDCFNSDDD